MQYDQDNAQSVQKSIFYPLSAEKSFSERFDILQKDVETLKEEEAHQSASHSATPKAESSHGPESSDRSETSDDAEMSTTRRRRKIRETRSQEIIEATLDFEISLPFRILLAQGWTGKPRQVVRA